MANLLTKSEVKHFERLYKFVSLTIAPVVFRKIGFKSKKYKLSDDTFLLFSNHSSEIDPAFQVLKMNKYVRYVASDHLFVDPKQAKLLDVIADPIINHHDRPHQELIDEIKANIAAGINVGINVEGRMSNNGETGFVSMGNAKLVKECGCDLVTYRFIGGYLRGPRWSWEKRKAPVYGEIVHIYKAAELAEMTVEEVYDHIIKDIYVNAYDEQRKLMHKYICENPAEHAEIILYGCPKCHSVGHLHTKYDTMTCDCCDFTAKVDEYSFWHSDDLEFDNIVDWDRWQKELIRADVEKNRGTDNLLYTHDHQKILDTFGGAKDVVAEDGKLALFADRFELTTDDGEVIVLPFEDLREVNYAGKQILQIVSDDHFYRVDCNGVYRAATQYVVAYRYFIGKENY